MWLLDANMDEHLVPLLREMGVSCDFARARGWNNFRNGDLVTAAAEAGFTCLLTQDRLFGESAARALKTFPSFCVVVVRLPQKPWLQYKARFLEAWTAAPIKPIPGKIVEWP